MNAEILAANVAAHWMQSGLLAAATLTALWLLKPARASFVLVALQSALLVTLVLPLTQPSRATVAVASADVTTTVSVAGEFLVHPAAGSADWTIADFAPLFVGLVLGGIALRLSWLLFGVARLRRFSRTAIDVPTPDVAKELEAELGIAPRYIVQPPKRGPWTFGILRPAIALPSTFDMLTPAVQRSIVCHELLHIKRRDVIAAIGEELVVAVLWFHPWSWLLRARIRVAREQVVDARAVAMLGRRDDYVRCLVDMSGHDLAPHLSHAGAGMLRPRELRARIDAILKEVHMSRRRATAAAAFLMSVMAGTWLMATGLFPLRAAGDVETVVQAPGRHIELERAFSRAQAEVRPSSQPRRQLRLTPAEYPPDALARGIRGTVLVDITINPTGDVTTASVVSGPQELHGAAFTTAMGLKYEAGPSTTAGRVGVQFHIERSSWGVRVFESNPSGTAGAELERAANLVRERHDDWAGSLRVGGNVQPPKKIKDVPPEYPKAAQDARVQGVVILEAKIDEGGSVSDVRLLRSIPMLDAAAIDAVRQWKYTPVLLNGAPTSVVMTMTVNFTLRDAFDIRVILPDGKSTMTMFGGGMMHVVLPQGDFHLRPMRDRTSNGGAVISVFHEDGKTLLGDVYAEAGGPIVPMPGVSGVALQLVAIR